MPPKNNKKKKGAKKSSGGGGGGSGSNGGVSTQFPTGDFGAQPAPPTSSSAMERWRDDIETKISTAGKTTEELIAMTKPPERLGETKDPEAAAYLEAYGLFSQGLRCGRHGDLEGAKSLIASAFLLDDRCMQVRLPVLLINPYQCCPLSRRPTSYARKTPS